MSVRNNNFLKKMEMRARKEKGAQDAGSARTVSLLQQLSRSETVPRKIISEINWRSEWRKRHSAARAGGHL